MTHSRYKENIGRDRRVSTRRCGLCSSSFKRYLSKMPVKLEEHRQALDSCLRKKVFNEGLAEVNSVNIAEGCV